MCVYSNFKCTSAKKSLVVYEVEIRPTTSANVDKNIGMKKNGRPPSVCVCVCVCVCKKERKGKNR